MVFSGCTLAGISPHLAGVPGQTMGAYGPTNSQSYRLPTSPALAALPLVQSRGALRTCEGLRGQGLLGASRPARCRLSHRRTAAAAADGQGEETEGAKGEEESEKQGKHGAEEEAEEGGLSSAESEEFRQRMESLVERQGKDEAFFDGKELARLIYEKYGRSYDVAFMRQEFMGRKLLAMNVMWKYREQKSFPLTEEEYLMRLDIIAENLRFWGAVGIVRESLAATKERPRIGKAVSIRIDLDENGERSREWINR